MNIKIIDLFCGAGGLTTGAMRVPGVEVIACVNHDENAIKSHRKNHPDVLHFPEDVRDIQRVVRPLGQLVRLQRKLDPGCIVLIWASLECTNFSKAKGGLPREADSRTLAYCLYDYIEAIDPDGLWIENVEEFMAWGPLDENGKPLSRKAGLDYLDFIETVKSYGYNFDYRILNSADFGAYTSRKRYFAQFMRHVLPISWPSPTHSKTGSDAGMFGDGLSKWKPVKHLLDFKNTGESIFTRKKKLVENTEKRILAGLIKYVANGDNSFIQKYYSGRPWGKVISVNGPLGAITTIDGQAVVQVAFMTQYNGGGHDQRVLSTDNPLTTVSTTNRHSVVQPEFLVKYHGTAKAASIYEPASTITTRDRLAAIWLDKTYRGSENHQSIEVPAGTVMTVDKHRVMTAFLMNPQYQSKGGSVENPCFTLIARMDKMPPYLVQVKESNDFAILVYEDDSETMKQIKLFMACYGICNIYMRMLTIEELLTIQGFPADYALEGNQGDKKKFIGNAVQVDMGEALIKTQAAAIQEYELQNGAMAS